MCQEMLRKLKKERGITGDMLKSADSAVGQREKEINEYEKQKLNELIEE